VGHCSSSLSDAEVPGRLHVPMLTQLPVKSRDSKLQRKSE